MRNVKVSEKTFKKLMEADNYYQEGASPCWLRSHAYYVIEQRQNYVIAIRRKYDVWNSHKENTKTYIRFTIDNFKKG